MKQSPNLELSLEHEQYGGLVVTTRQCKALADDLRKSAFAWVKDLGPTVDAYVVQTISVPSYNRRRGHCRAYIESLTQATGSDLIIVEGVGNHILADALTRWGWASDGYINDFYWPLTDAGRAAISASLARHKIGEIDVQRT